MIISRWIRAFALPVIVTGLVATVHAQSAATPPRASSSAAGAPDAPAPARPGGRAAAPAPGSTPASAPVSRGRAMDRVELEASRITGNRELPRVMYVVPWRQPGAGQVDGRPANSLVYELSAPVDREVARRELRYGQSAAGTESQPAP